MTVYKNCKQCGKQFPTTPSQIKKGGGKYCSRKCSSESRKVEKIITYCQYCGKEIHNTPYKIKHGEGKHCSTECRGKAQRGENNPNPSKHVEVNCIVCNTPFEVHPYELKRGGCKYCSRECMAIGMTGENHHRYVERIETNCLFCGKRFIPHPSETKRGRGKYCTKKCSDNDKSKFPTGINHHNYGIDMSGENNPNWHGGVSFEPYCNKFNDKFKERVRNYWGRVCGLCGKTEKQNRRKLDVHHVNYNKMVCCDNTPPLFIPTCRSCHNKTNYNRNFWEYYLTEYIMTYFNGESYLPK